MERRNERDEQQIKKEKKNGRGHPERRGSRDQLRHHVTLAWREIIHAAAILFCFSASFHLPSIFSFYLSDSDGSLRSLQLKSQIRLDSTGFDRIRLDSVGFEDVGSTAWFGWSIWLPIFGFFWPTVCLSFRFGSSGLNFESSWSWRLMEHFHFMNKWIFLCRVELKENSWRPIRSNPIQDQEKLTAVKRIGHLVSVQSKKVSIQSQLEPTQIPFNAIWIRRRFTLSSSEINNKIQSNLISNQDFCTSNPILFKSNPKYNRKSNSNSKSNPQSNP